MSDKATTTVLYSTDICKVICSIKISQRVNYEPCLVIASPNSVVSEQLYSIKLQSTTHNIFVHNVKNGSYVDFINSIALCMIKAQIPCDYLVAASYEGSILVYSPNRDEIAYSYIKGKEDLEILLEKCILKYNEFIC